MMNPYFLLAVLISLALSAFGGYRFGVEHERGEAALRENETAVATANALRETMSKDAQADLAAAQQSAARRAAARAKSHALELELARDETARNCRVADATVSLLNDAIARANGAPPEADRRDGGLPAAAAAVRPNGGRPVSLGDRILGGLRRLPSQSPAVAGVD